MAERGSKAAAIRQYKSEHPEAKATDIVKALKAQRIKVSMTQVYGIISKSNGKTPTPKPKSSPVVSDMPLIHAKQFVMASGGLEQARKVLDFIESLQLT